MPRETRASIEAHDKIYAREQLIKQIQAPFLAKISELEKRIKTLEVKAYIAEKG